MEAHPHQELLTALRRAMTRGGEYLTASFSGEPLPWQEDLTAVYRSPVALALTGNRELAQRIMARHGGRWIQEFGQIPAADPRELSLKSTRITNFHEFPLYQPAWLAVTASRLGRDELAQAALDYVMTTYDPGLGMLTLTGPNHPAYYELAQGAIGGIACGLLGRKEPETAMADLLARAVEAMLTADGSQLSFRLDATSGEPVMAPAAAVAHLYAVVPGEPAQFYWILGLVMWSLTAEARAGGTELCRQWISSVAGRVFEFLDRCHGDWRVYAPWKIAGAMAGLRGLGLEGALGARVERELITLAGNLVDLQNPDGSWTWPESGADLPPAEGIPSAAPAAGPSEVTADITAENVIWLQQIIGALEVGEAPGFGAVGA